MAALALFRVEDFKIDPHALGHRHEMGIAVEMILGRRQTQTTRRVVVVDRIFGIFRHLLIEIDRMGFQADHGLVATEIGHLGRAVPGRAGRQFVPFDHHTVGDAFLGQMIQRRTAGNAAADDNNLGMRFHAFVPESDPAMNCAGP